LFSLSSDLRETQSHSGKAFEKNAGQEQEIAGIGFYLEQTSF